MKKIFTKENLKKFFNSLIWLMILVFLIDIVSKWLVVKCFDGPVTRNYYDDTGAVVIINNFLYIGRTYNVGAAWSLGTTDDSSGKIVLMFVSLIMSGVLIFAYVKYYKKLTTLMKVALSLMIAGAVGNLIDRAFYWESITGFTGVVDWILFKFGKYRFPMFNIADSALVIGVILFLVQIIIDSVKESIEKAKAGEYKYSPEQLEKMKKNESLRIRAGVLALGMATATVLGGCSAGNGKGGQLKASGSISGWNDKWDGTYGTMTEDDKKQATTAAAAANEFNRNLYREIQKLRGREENTFASGYSAFAALSTLSCGMNESHDATGELLRGLCLAADDAVPTVDAPQNDKSGNFKYILIGAGALILAGAVGVFTYRIRQ